MPDNPKKNKITIIVISGVLILGLTILGFYFLSPTISENRDLKKFEDLQQSSGLIGEYHAMNSNTVDFVALGKKLNESVEKIKQEDYSFEEGALKIMAADSLSEVDRKKGTALLKSVAKEERYPSFIRATAIQFIINDYELDFIDREFPKKEIFTGPDFEKFLKDENGNIELAIRKLSEHSFSIFPTATAAHRIGKWYASQLSIGGLSQTEQNEFKKKVQEYLVLGDKLLNERKNILSPKLRGLNYELRARILDLSGGNKDEVKTLFEKSLAAYLEPPMNIFQTVYIARSNLYYAAFLMRNNKSAREIFQILESHYQYFVSPQPPQKRNIRLVSFLIAARDATEPNFPYPDFSRTDIENIKKFHPPFGEIITSLNLKEYIKGTPLEEKIPSD